MSFRGNNADEIYPRIWLGNRRAAMDDDFLQTHNIETVINCSKELPFHPYPRNRYRLPVTDNLLPTEIQHMGDWAWETMQYMLREYNLGRTILVHCRAGMQRSASVCAMFLMLHDGMTFDQAFAHLRQRRPIVFRPMINFKSAILRFEAELQQQRRAAKMVQPYSSVEPVFATVQ
jgi:protein-tyrosine phosphatase